MEYRDYKLGNEKFSVIGIGSEHLEELDQAQTNAIFDLAIENGVNVLDMYIPNPLVRDQVGVALAGRRDKMYIQGHLGTIHKNDQYERTRKLDEVKRSFDDMLTRMKTDYIDFGMIHYVDTEPDFQKVLDNGVYDYACELLKAGVIRKLGFSSHDPVIATKMASLDYMSLCMFSINPAYDMENSPDTDIWKMMEHEGFDVETAKMNPARLNFYDFCEAKGIALTVMKAFGGGTLLSDGTSPFGKAMSIYQCMKYALDKPAVVSTLLGVASADELKGALHYLDATEEEKDYSDVLTARDFGVTGRCMYCGHCQPCPAGITIAYVNKFFDLATIGDAVPDTVKDHYLSLPHHASECLKCGRCESNCPFGVHIRDRMQEAARVFGI